MYIRYHFVVLVYYSIIDLKLGDIKMGMLFVMLMLVELVVYIPLAIYFICRIFDTKTSILWRLGAIAVAIFGIFILYACTLEYLLHGRIMFEFKRWWN